MLRRTNILLTLPASSERSHLDVSLHSSIDVHLKALKKVSRSLHAAFAAFQDERNLLERLYYKGKNQHRLSLFWRRVIETRRFCDRLNEMNVDKTLDTLRNSFFNAGPISAVHKIPKGSWTHFPSRSSVGLVSTTIAHCCALLLKMRDKLLEAYSSFTLAMQSGAFLQLILAFIAIISRLRIICDTLHENLLSIFTVIEQLQALIPATVIGLSHKDIDLDPLLVVPTIQTTLAVENTNSSKAVEPVDSDLVNTASTTINSASTPARTVIKRNVPPIPEQKERKMKKRPKINDEIDDIFGF